MAVEVTLREDRSPYSSQTARFIHPYGAWMSCCPESAPARSGTALDIPQAFKTGVALASYTWFGLSQR
jgi:hypothetical protein